MEFYILFLIFIIANGTEALAGFGSTVFTLAIGSFFFPVEYLLCVIIPINIVLSTWTALRYKQFINSSMLLKKILPLCSLGFFIAFFVSPYLNQKIIATIFNFLILLIGLYGLLEKYILEKLHFQLPKNFLLILGGFSQGLFASGGPFVVAYTNSSHINKSESRSTLSILWLLLNTILLISFISNKVLNTEALSMSAKLLPAFFIGALIGFKLHEKISQQTFTKLVYFLLLLIGAIRLALT